MAAVAGVLGGKRGRREERPGRKKKEGGSSWRLGTAPGVASVLKRQAGGGIVGGERAPRSCSMFSAKKTRGELSESPLALEGFPGKT
jgi:hypothetical protein